MFLQLFLLVTILTILYKVRWYSCVKYIDKIPGPPVSFPTVLGHIPKFYGSLDEMWLKIRETIITYHPIVRLWSFEEPIVLTVNPDDAEILLSSTKHTSKSAQYTALHPWLETGLLTSSGEKWKSRRKILTPAFHFNILNEFVDVFEAQAEQLVNSVRASSTEILDIVPPLSKFTLNTICETAMGTRLKDDNEEVEDFRSAIHYMGSMLFIRILSPWMQLKWFFTLLPSGRKQARALKILHHFSTRMIQDRKKYHQEHDVTDFESLASGSGVYDVDEKSKKRVALLDLLISVWKRGGIDDIGIREEVDTFTFEGHDTTACGLIFTVLLLAEHQGIQERARREVNEAFQKSNGKLGMQELQNLVYLDRCIKEGLRLYPSVPIIGRVTAEDVKLSNYLIPKGTTVAIPVYDLHRDPNIWPNPHAYDPDRFLPEKIRTRHPYSYIPFSAGPRNCIGQKFASLELKSAIAHLLHNFRLEAIDKASDARLLQDIIVRCDNPLRVRFLPLS